MGGVVRVGRWCCAGLIVTIMTTMLGACGGTEQQAEPAGQRPAFYATWLPTYMTSGSQSTAPEYVAWSGPGVESSGLKAEAYTFMGDSTHQGSSLTLDAVSTLAFPSDYWSEFNSSSAYQHRQWGDVSVALDPFSQAKTVGIGYSHGCIIQFFARNIPVDDLGRFFSSLEWR